MPKPERVIEAPRELLEELARLTRQREERQAARMAQVDVFDILRFEPLCKPRVIERLAGVPEDELPPLCGDCPQERFLSLPEGDMDVLYGGAGGGSKSTSMILYAIRACVRFPGLQAFWFRRSFPELNQSVLRALARYNYAKDLGARWDGSKYELRFPGGSILTFAHAKNLQEAASLSSAEINLLLIDERTTIDPDVVEFLYTRVRSGVVGVPCLGVRSASNPGHVGHQDVAEGWVEATDYGKKEIIDPAGRVRIFIPAKVSDNPYVKNYAQALEGISDPDLRRRILDGDWSAMPDAAFPDWRRDRIVVPPFEIPESWERYAGVDYGWTSPSVYMGVARDADGRLWFHAELTMVQTAEREQARRILAAEGVTPPRFRAADPAMWGKTGSALPPAVQFAIEGCPLKRADHDRFGGKQRIHSYLSEAPACAHHRALGWDTCPMLHVLDGLCPEFAKTMGSLPRDPHRPEDVLKCKTDHWYDAGRYAIQSIGTAPSMIFDDTPATNGELVQVGPYGYNRGDLSIPARTPIPGVTPGVARQPGQEDWSQVF